MLKVIATCQSQTQHTPRLSVKTIRPNLVHKSVDKGFSPPKLIRSTKKAKRIKGKENSEFALVGTKSSFTTFQTKESPRKNKKKLKSMTLLEYFKEQDIHTAQPPAKQVV